MEQRRLFGTSGIRGLADKDLKPDFCLDIGKAIGTYLGEKTKICVATDARLSRDVIKLPLVSGLLSCGVNVSDLGIKPTPILAFMTREGGFDTGIMITASHNPPEYNGIKLFNKDTSGYSEEQERELEEIYFKRRFQEVEWYSFGRVVKENIEDTHFHFFKKYLSGLKINKDLKIVVDPGNGAASKIASDIFRKLGMNIIPLNDDPKGIPDRSSEPKEETLEGTIRFLNKQDADLAICFDGDADRVVFCDREGFMGYNEMISYISRIVTEKSKNRCVVTTVETGRLLDLAVKDVGGSVVRTKVGDVQVAQYLRRYGGCIGVEQIGVYVIPEVGYYPASFHAALTLLNQIEHPKDVREFFKTIPALFFVKEKLNCPNEMKHRVMEEIKKRMSDFGHQEVNLIDGIRLEFDDSWMLLRASGTEPSIRVLVESESKERMKELVDKGVEVVKNSIERVKK
jgi:phosphoglucosamine mutase